MFATTVQDELPFVRVIIPLDLLRPLRRHVASRSKEHPCAVSRQKEGATGCVDFLCPDDACRNGRLQAAVSALGLGDETVRRIVESHAPSSADPFPSLIGGIVARLTSMPDEQRSAWERLSLGGTTNSLGVLREVFVPEVFETLFDEPFADDETRPASEHAEIAWLRSAGRHGRTGSDA